jgi:hypothetical protein
VAQCQADARLWANNHIESDYYDGEHAKTMTGANNNSAINKLSIHEIVARIHKLNQCNQVDSDHLPTYRAASDFYSLVIDGRHADFFGRHPEIYQMFAEEDEAGAR